MLTKRKRRLYFILLLIAGISFSVGLALFALKQNINLYYTPQQVLEKKLSHSKIFRLGGMVVKHSVHHVPNSLQVSFVVTDFHRQIKINYNGILPSLFREGQGIVAQGTLNAQGIFIASQVLAKHNATYRPPEIVDKHVSL